MLHNLRRALPDPDQFLDVTPRTLRWREDAPFWLDVAAFEESLSRAERRAVHGRPSRAVLYEWLLGEREGLRQCYLEALARLAALLEERGDYTQAIRYAERLLRHDPLQEETYRLLMRLHDARGDRARALRVYHVCVATLEHELGVEPSAPTPTTSPTTRSARSLTLSPARRRHHLRVAQALERIYAHDPGPVSGQLAAHYERAGAADEADIWYGRAAEAMQLHANVEAAYGDRLKLLTALKDHYDPTNFFRLNANIPPSEEARP